MEKERLIFLKATSTYQVNEEDEEEGFIREGTPVSKLKSSGKDVPSPRIPKNQPLVNEATTFTQASSNLKSRSSSISSVKTARNSKPSSMGGGMKT